MTTKTTNGTTELDTFLPQDNSGTTNGVTKYKLNKNNDLEAAVEGFDPFRSRQLEHPVTDCDTLTHLLKAALGTGILAMPAAFQASGLALGVVATVLIAILCGHCAYILVECAHDLYYRCGVSAMSYADVAENACLKGPKWAKRYAQVSRMIILASLFVTYFLTCSCYAVIVAKSFNYVADMYLGYAVNLRVTIAILIIPLILLTYVPNLKYLAPVSMAANLFMAVGLGITLYYLVSEIPPLSERVMVGPVEKFPIFFSITIFALEAIGVVMPLENHMKTPKHFIGICGVLNQGMAGVTLIYILVGFFGYLRYGDKTLGSITLNLPKEEYAAQAVNILIGLAVFCTTGLQFYVCLEIAWNGIKEKFSKKETLANYTLRTVLIFVSVVIAVAVPTIVPFVSLIGAFCFSILGILCPVFIEIITFWDKGFGAYNWKIVKNVVVVVAGVLALIFGSKSAIEDIVAMYI